ncbi:MAG: hypothetical protein QXV29_02075 [Candidatus Woesearchaeota archaeon]
MAEQRAEKTGSYGAAGFLGWLPPSINYKEEYFSKEKYKRDELEIAKDQLIVVDWPKPLSKYRLVYESQHQSIENMYFWLLDNLRNDLAFPVIEKITDVFAASEHSAFFGAAAQKLGLQQDKVAQFLKIIHDIFKGVILLVRDIRIIDEKLGYYEKSFEKGDEAEAAEIALKGQYVDLVEGGAKSPTSVLGLALEAQFTTLPDLFFKLRIEPGEKDETFFKRIAQLPYSETLKSMLKRKLESYYRWKKATYGELKTRRNFTLHYLRQQYDTIMLYMHWIKPYLRTIQRLSLDVSKMSEPELIAAFEGSLVEIEILARRLPAGNRKVNSCCLIHLDYRTRPSMSFYVEPYHKGPIHVGEVVITWRSYAWTPEQIDEYKKMRASEELDLLANADASLMEAIRSIGEDLQKYLEEAWGLKKKEEAKKEVRPASPGILEPFVALAQGFASFFPKAKPGKKEEITSEELKKEQKEAENDARKRLWLNYKLFKKAHGMISWD